MIYTIENETLKVQIADLGAELQSIRTKDGTEYLWQGDAAYWRGRAYNLFPYVGRMTEGKYTLEGRTYELSIHGFARNATFTVEKQEKDNIVFALTDSRETLPNYPFAFLFQIIYRLEGNRLLITYAVENKSEKTMHFSVGGHPGFMVPLEEGLTFEDYCVEFAEECHPTRIGISPKGLVDSSLNSPYDLEGGKRLPLNFRLFDQDAIVLQDMARTLTVCSDQGKRAVRVSFPQMDYVGIWQMNDGPFLCIEPWSALPSREDIIEDLEDKPGLTHLPTGKHYENEWSIEII